MARHKRGQVQERTAGRLAGGWEEAGKGRPLLGPNKERLDSGNEPGKVTVQDPGFRRPRQMAMGGEGEGGDTSPKPGFLAQWKYQNYL